MVGSEPCLQILDLCGSECLSNTLDYYDTATIEQHVFVTNAGKQLSKAATDV
jgi:hypothetical protein